MNEQPPIKNYVSSLLPPDAAECLRRAAAKCSDYPEGSVIRAKIMYEAIRKVREEHPEAFRNHGRCR